MQEFKDGADQKSLEKVTEQFLNDSLKEMFESGPDMDHKRLLDIAARAEELNVFEYANLCGSKRGTKSEPTLPLFCCLHKNHLGPHQAMGQIGDSEDPDYIRVTATWDNPEQDGKITRGIVKSQLDDVYWLEDSQGVMYQVSKYELEAVHIEELNIGDILMWKECGIIEGFRIPTKLLDTMQENRMTIQGAVGHKEIVTHIQHDQSTKITRVIQIDKEEKKEHYESAKKDSEETQ